jgi:hypothetical protein
LVATESVNREEKTGKKKKKKKRLQQRLCSRHTRRYWPTLGLLLLLLFLLRLCSITVMAALSSMEYACTQYPATWAAWTLLILFSEMLNFLNFFLTKNLSRKIYGSFSNILFAEMKISKLINYSTDLYQT